MASGADGLAVEYLYSSEAIRFPFVFATETVNRKKLLARLSRNELRNVAFSDMMALVEAFGFRVERTRGSHHILTHPHIAELVDLQEVNGEAKPYQIRQSLRIVERHNPRWEDET
jgi:predicted RNA binding protein YcfA (HicA-like mRNA interferase family)